MALTCLLSTSQTFDAVAYARGMIEDDSASPVISDARIQLYLETVAEDFSRHLPLDLVVGNVNAGTSTLNTASGTQRYVCNTTNGFTVAPTRIVTVQGIGASLNASSDLAYFFLDPAMISRGFVGPAAIDAPSSRIIRNEYLDELDTYARTYYDVVRDSTTGLLALDFYPIPQAANPVYVRYQAQHVDSGTGVARKYTTIPEEHKRNFGDLLYATLLMEMATRLALRTRATAGLITREGGAVHMRLLAFDVRERVYNELSGGTVALVG